MLSDWETEVGAGISSLHRGRDCVQVESRAQTKKIYTKYQINY